MVLARDQSGLGTFQGTKAYFLFDRVGECDGGCEVLLLDTCLLQILSACLRPGAFPAKFSDMDPLRDRAGPTTGGEARKRRAFFFADIISLWKIWYARLVDGSDVVDTVVHGCAGRAGLVKERDRESHIAHRQA